MTAQDLFNRELNAHAQILRDVQAKLAEPFDQWVALCRAALAKGGKILFFGNGGSAADAQHLATELVVRYERNRAAMAALALSTDTSALTAIGNDFGFDEVFARQIDALCGADDVAIGISTSGASPNVLRGLVAARAKGAVTVGLTGRDGGAMTDLCDVTLVVPSDNTARIQEMHITLGHMLCAALERPEGPL